jgi:Domain of unknown function (DUF5680)
MNDFNRDLYLNFLHEARRRTYVDEKQYTVAPIHGFKGNTYLDGKSQLTVLQTGIEQLFVLEIGYRGKVPVWTLTHHGKFLSATLDQDSNIIKRQCFIMDVIKFLRDAVGANKNKCQARGPQNFIKGPFEYECDYSSDTPPTHGKENIYYQEAPIYRARFNAQWLIND